jgi:hypothetical protein
MTYSQTPYSTRNQTSQDAATEVEEAGDQDDYSPSTWIGELSGAEFACQYENDARAYVMSVKLDLEHPILVKEIYATPAETEIHSALLDLSLAFARGDDLETDVVHKNALGLRYAADVFDHTGKNLKSGMLRRQKEIEISRTALRQIKQACSGAEAMIRISDRIKARLSTVIGSEALSRMNLLPQQYVIHQAHLIN